MWAGLTSAVVIGVVVMVTGLPVARWKVGNPWFGSEDGCWKQTWCDGKTVISYILQILSFFLPPPPPPPPRPSFLQSFIPIFLCFLFFFLIFFNCSSSSSFVLFPPPPLPPFRCWPKCSSHRRLPLLVVLFNVEFPMYF